MKTNFSIITINKNNAIGLKATIESVKKQKITKFKFEHIIIDGRSHDKSKNIIKKNKKYFSFSQSKKDDGIYNAMNIGIKKAKFDWLIFLNSGDTFCENNTLKKISAIIEKKPSIYYGNIIQTYRSEKKIRTPIDEKKLFKIVKSNQIFHQGCVISKNLNLKNLYDEKLKIISDYKFLYNVFNKKKIFKKINLNIAVVPTGGISSKNKFQSVIEKKNFFSKKKISIINSLYLQYEFLKYYILEKLNNLS